ncbi:hypothetical protein F4781DRAFT_333570 [Annulohypoxylon bovei var. microspora]|nr:hypothetical protein F4781DRAFT_333570 [Annulohypoxylon bovei var. microspora]
MSAPASVQYCIREIKLAELEEPQITDLASWISHNARFSPYDQIHRSLLPSSTPFLPYQPSQSTPLEIEGIKRVIIKEKGNEKVHLLVVTGPNSPYIHGLAWLSVWNNQLLGEPVNEEFMDPSRDHHNFLNHMLRNETPYEAHRRQAWYIETAKALRNKRFAQFQGDVIGRSPPNKYSLSLLTVNLSTELRDIILSTMQPDPLVLGILVKSAIEVGQAHQVPIITTLPRLYLEINHELDRQGFRVVDTEKYPFTCLNSHGMRLAELRYPKEDLQDLAPFLKRVPVDVMLRIYDKAASPQAKSSLSQLGI